MSRILIIDMDQELDNSLKAFFSSKGYEVQTVWNARSALRMLKKKKYHIVFLDIAAFPGMEGLDLIKKIGKIEPSAKVIVMTSLKNEVLAKQTIELGAFDYITKPPNLDYMETAVVTGIALQ